MSQETEPPQRFWTRRSIDELSDKFKLPNDASMQDWPYEVADPARVKEFVAALGYYSNDADILFTLADIILQSLEESDLDFEFCEEWKLLRAHLLDRFELHAWQIWYWSDFGASPDDAWRISPYVRKGWTTNPKH